MSAILCFLGNINAQDWSIGVNHKTILTRSSSFSKHGFAVFNDQMFTPVGLTLSKEIHPKWRMSFSAMTAERSVVLSYGSFFAFNAPIDEENFKMNIDNDIYILSTALNYKFASFNKLRIQPFLGLSVLLENARGLYQVGFFRSTVFEDETAVVEFSQRLMNEINPYFDLGFEVLIPVFNRVDFGITYIHSRPIFGDYYTQNYDFAQLIGTVNSNASGLRPLPQRYVVNEQFTDRLTLDSFSFSLSYRFK